jgi:hypothetical protein
MACKAPTVTVLDDPNPEPSDGISPMVVISTPFNIPVTRSASRISS